MALHREELGGFLSSGGTPVAGGFISWKIVYYPMKIDDIL